MPHVSRRSFLAASGALVVAIHASSAAAREPEIPHGLDAFLAITPEDEVIVYSPSTEMGQGVTTALAMIVAEELDADWLKVRVEHAPLGRSYRRRVGPRLWLQSTGASSSVADWHQPLQEAGARARARLLQAAADRFDVAPEACRVEHGVVMADGQQATFGELAALAAEVRVGRDVTPKARSTYATRGTNLPRLDLPAKVTGKARFGSDVRVADLLFATSQKSPVFGGRVGAVDDAAARQVPGVVDVLVFETWFAVVARHNWAAQRGLAALSVEWEEGEEGKEWIDTASLRAQRAAGLGPDAKIRVVQRGPALDEADEGVVSAVYDVPYLDHQCMSPQTATAHVTETHCTIWAPTQSQTLAQRAAKRICGLPSDAITVHTTLLGGGFGRRTFIEDVEQVIEIAQRVGQPVQLQWTREESTRQGRYRPAAAAKMRAQLDDAGEVAAMHVRIARQSEFDFYVPDFAEGWPLAARLMAEGLWPMPYGFETYRLEIARLDAPVPVGFWRSVSHSSHTFFVESFVDELAHAAGVEPATFRSRLLAKAPRHRAVLEMAVDRAGSAPAGRCHGLALQEAYGSFCAQVVEISVDRGWPIVHRVVCALDCGEVIHPDGARAQIMGGVQFGLSAALYGRIDIAEGRSVQSNFHDAPILRMHEAPEVEVHFVDSPQPPTGVGELGTPPIAPALCNALFAATGQRIRRLPLVEVLERA
ncbi:MAG: molybdopterin cofactor-binding domain-containing protein [Myxococcota bacterium]